MSHLAVAVRHYFKTHTCTVSEVEGKAGLPRMSIGSILRNAHPRPEKLGQLLSVIDDDSAMAWLDAYLLDDVPEAWLHRVSIHIKELELPETLKEPSSRLTQHDYDVAWQRLREVITRDTETGQWFCQTVALILGDREDHPFADPLAVALGVEEPVTPFQQPRTPETLRVAEEPSKGE
jgi:hypothetical protein